MYKVGFYIDAVYEVYTMDDNGENYISHYQGSLADCEAWIRLKEDGRL
jgi:hypothetical protein